MVTGDTRLILTDDPEHKSGGWGESMAPAVLRLSCLVALQKMLQTPAHSTRQQPRPELIFITSCSDPPGCLRVLFCPILHTL